MGESNRDRIIRCGMVVEASVDAVWDAWTTEEGIKSFFAPACNIDLRVDGLYEIFFDPTADRGRRGADGVRILALEPRKMISFTWNAPLHLPHVRNQWTHVVVRLDEVSPGQTRVSVTHDGWGEGEEWDQAFQYFTHAWNDLVLPRLGYRFSVGPVDRENWPRSE